MQGKVGNRKHQDISVSAIGAKTPTQKVLGKNVHIWIRSSRFGRVKTIWAKRKNLPQCQDEAGIPVIVRSWKMMGQESNALIVIIGMAIFT